MDHPPEESPPTGSGLNPAQHEAVTHRDGPLLVVAGPGSGKTRVLTQRIAHLVSTGVDPSRILAITFTNKAADEMLERTVKLLGGEGAFASMPHVSTFHSYCARLLRRSIYNLEGYHSNYTIYDTVDQKSVVDEILKERNLDKNSYPASGCLSKISFWKNHLVEAEQAFEEAETQRGRDVALVFKRYAELLRERNALDFDDLLILTLRLLRECPDVRERERELRQYVLVDEFQDTNRPQYLIARFLCEGHRNLCITGDPDQSIYSWRGASPENFQRFDDDFPERKVVLLEQNYRSTQNILRVASRLTGTLVGQRALFTENDEGDTVVIEELPEERAEARRMIKQIYEWQSDGTPLGEMAVLYRMNSQSRSIEEALVREQIPYIIVGGIAFYHRKEVKDVLAYLRAANNPRDEVAVRRVINVPPRGIGNVTLDRLEDTAREHRLSLGELLEQPGRWDKISSRARAALHGFVETLERIRAASNLPLPLQVVAATQESKYEEYLERSEPESYRERAENLSELSNAAAEAEDFLRRRPPVEGEPTDPLSVFLERVSLVADIDSWEAQQERVALMTLHAAKGLEFDRVMLPGVEDGTLPHSRSDLPGSVDEERRLLYVGITRARESVRIYHCTTRRRFREREPRLPSPFLEELAGEGVEEQRELPSFLAHRQQLHREGMVEEFEDVWEEDDDGIRKGALLDHDMLGPGVVIRVSGRGPSKRVTVQFRDHGEKSFVASYAPFRVIGYQDE